MEDREKMAREYIKMLDDILIELNAKYAAIDSRLLGQKEKAYQEYRARFYERRGAVAAFSVYGLTFEK